MKKKLLFIGLCACAIMANAEEYTLDLSTATDMSSTPIKYETEDILVYNGNVKDVWDSTYSVLWSSQYIYANDAKFMFSHLLSGYNDYNSWEGFTVSKNAADTLNQFGCMAKGGLKGMGTPFVVGYYSNYMVAYPNVVLFSDNYYPKEVYICQSAYTYSSITKGDAYAKKFTSKDTLSLIISAYDGVSVTDKSVTYYLAVDSAFNKAWTKVDLSSLGECMGLSFSMNSTDKGQYGINTPTYFCLDGLTVSTEAPTPSAVFTPSAATTATKRIVDGRLVIERDGCLYDVTGARLQ